MSNEFSHHGIKGMRWGIRRYQNKDGTLTSAGKQRYGNAERREEKKAEKIQDMKAKYRSKARTADDHYKRAIRRAGDAKNRPESKNPKIAKDMQKLGKYLAPLQYDKAQEYEKQARQLERKLRRQGVSIGKTPEQLARQREAGKLFVKKTPVRYMTEKVATEFSIKGQVVVQQILFGKPVLPVIANEISKYKLR